MHGFGKCLYENGDTYEGNFKGSIIPVFILLKLILNILQLVKGQEKEFIKPQMGNIMRENIRMII